MPFSRRKCKTTGAKSIFVDHGDHIDYTPLSFPIRVCGTLQAGTLWRYLIRWHLQTNGMIIVDDFLGKLGKSIVTIHTAGLTLWHYVHIHHSQCRLHDSVIVGLQLLTFHGFFEFSYWLNLDLYTPEHCETRDAPYTVLKQGKPHSAEPTTSLRMSLLQN